LPQHGEAKPFATAFGFEDDDVVLIGVRGPEAVDAADLKQAFVDDPIEQRAAVLVQLARRRAVLRVLQDPREAALSTPTR
jgi:hypothetical protein